MSDGRARGGAGAVRALAGRPAAGGALAAGVRAVPTGPRQRVATIFMAVTEDGPGRLKRGGGHVQGGQGRRLRRARAQQSHRHRQRQPSPRAPDLPSARFDLLYAALRVVSRAENRQNTRYGLSELIRGGRPYRDTVDALKMEVKR